jgi:hypothetical protein
VSEYDREASKRRGPGPKKGRSATGNKEERKKEIKKKVKVFGLTELNVREYVANVFLLSCSFTNSLACCYL